MLKFTISRIKDHGDMAKFCVNAMWAGPSVEFRDTCMHHDLKSAMREVVFNISSSMQMFGEAHEDEIAQAAETIRREYSKILNPGPAREPSHG